MRFLHGRALANDWFRQDLGLARFNGEFQLISSEEDLMVDFGNLEARLNSDQKLRAAFLADPVAVLAGEGVILSAAQANALRTAVARMGPSKPAIPFINNYRTAPKPGSPIRLADIAIILIDG